MKRSITLSMFDLLLKNISRHIISFEAAILEKSLNPPALNLRMLSLFEILKLVAVKIKL